MRLPKEAIRLVEVEWEVLPFVMTVEESLQPGAPLVYNPHSFTAPSVRTKILLNRTYRLAGRSYRAKTGGCTDRVF
jgi:CO/xanthine dehydrogenase Mo-binding subunit